MVLSMLPLKAFRSLLESLSEAAQASRKQGPSKSPSEQITKNGAATDLGGRSRPSTPSLSPSITTPDRRLRTGWMRLMRDVRYRYRVLRV